MITKEGIIEINKKFDSGKVVNLSSLDFAFSHLKNTKDWIKQLAFLVRAILIDHVFEEGNKRTTSALMVYYIEAHGCAYDPYKIDKIIVEIIKKNINSIEQIRRMIKNVIR